MIDREPTGTAGVITVHPKRVSSGTTFALTCSLPAAFHKAIEETVHSTLEQGLPALSQGESVFLSEFDDYRPYPGKPPARVRTGDNPLDRKEYLAQVARR